MMQFAPSKLGSRLNVPLVWMRQLLVLNRQQPMHVTRPFPASSGLPRDHAPAHDWLCKIVALTLISMLSSSTFLAAQEDLEWQADRKGFDEHVNPFLERFCFDCHQGSSAEANLQLDRDLKNDFFDPVESAHWREIVDVLNSHGMPPKDSEQPTVEETATLVDWVTHQLILAEERRRENVIVMRRLNVDEYRRTINALFGIDYDTSHFPEDPPAGGFDNNGSALSLSPLHLELYFESSQQILDQVITVGEPPDSISWRFEVESGDSDRNRVRYDGQNLIVNGGKNQVIDGFKVMHHESWDRKLNVRPFQVPAAGEYLIRIRAGAKVPNRSEVVESAAEFLAERRERDDSKRPDRSKYHLEAFERDLAHFQEDPMYEYGPPRLRVIQHLGGQPKVIAEFDIDATHTAPEVYEFKVHFTTERAGITLEYAYSLPRVLENFWFQSDDRFARPEVWVDWFELQGPTIEPWPSAAHSKLFEGTDYEHNPCAESNSDEPKRIKRMSPAEMEDARIILGRLMRQAYRRPIEPSELDVKLATFTQSRTSGNSFEHSIRLAISAVLVSPNFLFLSERLPPATHPKESLDASSPPNPRELNAFELATRMSYFLWSGPPDERLTSLAEDGSLLQPSVRQREVNRMLADPRARALADNFAAQWLGLRDVGANPPAADLFPRYDVHLEQSMREEPKAFFMEILEDDLSITNFIQSDFVMINERLARFYGIPNVQGDHFRRVSIGKESHRGGVMTQGSMLTITSNGTRTSPVKRGTWLLETMLGISPGLPVANAGEIAPKVPGIDKATVRVRLEAHRELPQCARCHNRIDPLGFALENYDGSGRWREKEGFGYKGRIGRNDPDIDASSQLPDGTAINGIHDLQLALLDRKQEFYHCLASKLASYAIGREIGITDQVTLDTIVEKTQQGDETLRDIIQAIVASKLFLTK